MDDPFWEQTAGWAGNNLAQATGNIREDIKMKVLLDLHKDTQRTFRLQFVVKKKLQNRKEASNLRQL